MTNGFAEFADAASRSSVSKQPSDVPSYDRVSVLGGGEDARLIAALCLANVTASAATLRSQPRGLGHYARWWRTSFARGHYSRG